MNIKLYTNNSSNNTVNKSVTLLNNITGTLVDSLDQFSPSVMISEDDFIPECNYFYIADLGKYYYIDGLSYDNTGILTIMGKEDTLMSFKDDLLELEALVSVNEQTLNHTYNTNNLQQAMDVFHKTYKFSNAFNNNKEYILVTAGLTQVTP